MATICASARITGRSRLGSRSGRSAGVGRRPRRPSTRCRFIVHDCCPTEGDEFPEARELARRTGHRTILSVPLLREGESIGASCFAAPKFTVQRKTDRPAADLRRPGGDRHRERPAVRRGAGKDARAHRIAAAADRHRRRAEGDQPLGLRPANRARRPCRSSPRGLCEADKGDLLQRDGD